MEPVTDILTLICKRAALGDNDARTVLYNRFSTRMYSICVRMSGNRQDAEDILQEAFVTAFQQLGRLREAALFEPWLRRIVIHACTRHARKSIRWEELGAGPEPMEEEEGEAWWTLLPFECVHEEIKALPAGCREVFNLYVIEDCSHQEVAALLGVSVSTSKSQYHRARHLLRARLMQKNR